MSDLDQVYVHMLMSDNKPSSYRGNECTVHDKGDLRGCYVQFAKCTRINCIKMSLYLRVFCNVFALYKKSSEFCFFEVFLNIIVLDVYSGIKNFLKWTLFI